MDARAAVSSPPSAPSLGDRLEVVGLLSLFGFAAALQISIAVAQSLLAIAVLSFVGTMAVRGWRIEVPRFFWPLAGYAAATLVSSAFSADPRASFADSKQLVLFLIVPVAFHFLTGQRGLTLLTVIVSVGAASAAFGIFQYGLLHYDQLGQRPRGALGHYMTYSGLLMLVTGAAFARVLFGRSERVWAALAMPALAVALALTLSRSAWVGACAAAAVLIALKDFRLLATLPVAAALVFALAPRIPAPVVQRAVSIFDPNDATNRDRVAMLREGVQMVRAHPLVGVGPDMVEALYAEYRVPEAVEKVNPHLHNVPMQIAAERGLPALALWIAFVVTLALDLARRFRDGPHRVVAAGGLAAVVAMLAAGMFEYNFGDSEFLMLFLLLVSLPFAARRPMRADAAA